MGAGGTYGFLAALFLVACEDLTADDEDVDTALSAEDLLSVLLLTFVALARLLRLCDCLGLPVEDGGSFEAGTTGAGSS